MEGLKRDHLPYDSPKCECVGVCVCVCRQSSVQGSNVFNCARIKCQPNHKTIYGFQSIGPAAAESSQVVSIFKHSQIYMSAFNMWKEMKQNHKRSAMTSDCLVPCPPVTKSIRGIQTLMTTLTFKHRLRITCRPNLGVIISKVCQTLLTIVYQAPTD